MCKTKLNQIQLSIKYNLIKMHNKHHLQHWNMRFTLDLMVSSTYCDPWHPICLSACLLWQLPYRIWIKAPLVSGLPRNFHVLRSGRNCGPHQSKFMRLTGDMGRLRGAPLCLQSKDHFEVKGREGWTHQYKPEMVEIPLAIQNGEADKEGKRKMKNTNKGQNTERAYCIPNI